MQGLHSGNDKSISIGSIGSIGNGSTELTITANSNYESRD